MSTIRAMPSPDDDKLELLRQTSEKAARLLEKLQHEREDLAAHVATPRRIDPQVAAEGLTALDHTAASLAQLLADAERGRREREQGDRKTDSGEGK